MKRPALNVLFEDDDYVAIDKPPNLLSIPDRFDKTLPNALSRLRETRDVWIVHRIDRPTSGILVFARNPDAHRSLCMAFERHEVRKTYLAIVDGVVARDKGSIDAPIGEDPSVAGTVMIDRRHGKPAVTDYVVVDRFRNHSLIKAIPKTGRQHQIRIHMKTIGHSLTVDEIYGHRAMIFLSELKKNFKPKEGEPERPLMSRLTLHASELCFMHYRTGESVRIEAPLPKDFRGLLNQLRKTRL